MQTMKPCLFFENRAQEAVEFYLSIFSDASILETMPGPGGTAMGFTFRLLGQEFMALNGGAQFAFTPAISFFVTCETQAEVDDLWAKLSEGGAEQRCGWLTDKFGVSWQIVPGVLGAMLQDKNRQKAQRVFQAMLGMVRLDIAELRKAYEHS